MGTGTAGEDLAAAEDMEADLLLGRVRVHLQERDLRAKVAGDQASF